MNSNWLLGLLAVAGAGGAFYFYQKNRKETKGVEVATSDTSTKWFYEPITREEALEIASYCRNFTLLGNGPLHRSRNIQVLNLYGYQDLAATCAVPGIGI